MIIVVAADAFLSHDMFNPRPLKAYAVFPFYERFYLFDQANGMNILLGVWYNQYQSDINLYLFVNTRIGVFFWTFKHTENEQNKGK